VAEALCYKPEGRGSIPDEAIVLFNSPNPSSRTVALELIRLLTEMSARNLPVGEKGVKLGRHVGRQSNHLL
jgi:hypothetical protein